MSLESRLAIEEFETLAKGIILRGYYRPGGESGASLRKLMTLSRPALHPHIADPDRLDAEALGYVLQRLPDGIWGVRQITVVREIEPEVAGDFEAVGTRARRRPTFRTGPASFVTAFRGGMSDLVDFISAITCFQIESDKIRARYSAFLQKLSEDPDTASVWRLLGGGGLPEDPAGRRMLLHELSVEFRCDYGSVKSLDASLGGRLPEVVTAIASTGPRDLKVVFSDRFGLVGMYSRRAKLWTSALAGEIALGGSSRPVFVVSSNRHSMVNCLSPFVRERWAELGMKDPEDYSGGRAALEDPATRAARAARDSVCIRTVEVPGDMPFCQVIDLPALEAGLVDGRLTPAGDGLLVNMDYAFGEEGFFLLNEILETFGARVRGVFVMGKAGILRGDRGDIMLPSFFVKQGSGDVYDTGNCLSKADFEGLGCGAVHEGGPMLTVAGTFLQNSAVLSYFRDNWGVLGVEMEGIPYAKAIRQAVLRGRTSPDMAVGIAYYASDAPLAGDLLSVPLGERGVGPVYAASLAILRKVFELS